MSKAGEVFNNKGVDVINRIIELEFFTEKYIKTLELTNQHNINNLFLSFCKSKDAIIKARNMHQIQSSLVKQKVN